MMIITELPNFENDYQVKQEPLLEYVWEMALLYDPVEGDYENEPADTIAPYTFAKRYLERRQASFEEASGNEQHNMLDISYKQKFLDNEDLQNTIEAFGLDVSKFWYLLLFVHDYIEDFGSNVPTVNKTTRAELNDFIGHLSEASCLIMKSNNRKSYTTERKDVLDIVRNALDYYMKLYDEITNDSNKEEISKKLINIGLHERIDDRSFDVNYDKCKPLDITYKKWFFAEVFLNFLSDKKAKVSSTKKVKVSKDKMIFISRLIYTVGYDDERYNEEYDDEGNKNRMLSNLLRKYKHNKFPLIIHNRYW